ncbi:MAG: hypothetical protein UF067_09665 [Paludibacteraceae bacterium]|nr:hypothetical protein [Paludibacteraceae bacterium]
MEVKDLKKMSKTDLYNIICAKEKQITDLNFEIEELKSELQDRKISLEETGSIANAAVQISGVLDAAQKAANIYLENVKEQTENQKKVLENELAAAKTQAEQIIKDAEVQAVAKWNDLTARLEEFYSVHAGLKDLLKNSGVDPDRLV